MAENYLLYGEITGNELRIYFDNVIYNQAGNYLFFNNIDNNILTIHLGSLYGGDMTDAIGNVSFIVNNMYIFQFDGRFTAYLYDQRPIKVSIIYNDTYNFDTFQFEITNLYLIEELHDLLIPDILFIPRDTDEIFELNNNELYLNLDNYELVEDTGVPILTKYNINCIVQQDESNTHLIVKGEIPSKIVDYLQLGSKKFKVYAKDNVREELIYSINDGSRFHINNESSTANDSSINLTDVILTENKLKQSFWNGFYVNQITMLKSQKALLDTIDLNYRWKMEGYHVSTITYANVGDGTLILEDNKTLVENVISNNQTLELIIKKQKVPGFLGTVEEGTIPDTPLSAKLLKVYSSIQGEFDPDSTYVYLKIILPEMEVVQDSNIDFEVKDNFYFKLGSQDFEYLVLNILVDGSWTSRTFQRVYYDDNTQTNVLQVFQEINIMNVINGIVDNNLLKPRLVNNVYNSRKEIILPTVTFSENSQTVPIATLKTTNCLGEYAQLNIVVQGPIPVDWYGWLPLNEVYVDDNKNVLVNPTGSGNYSSFTKIVSVNALPSDDIGIDPEFPSSIDLSTVDL